MSQSRRFQILSLSGGGFFGLYTASVLEALEKKSGRPLAQSFDLIAGTSVGGIVAAGIALEVPAAKIVAAFQKNGIKIFSDRPAATSTWGVFRDLSRFAFRPKYTGEALYKTIADIVGKNAKIGDLKHRLLIPAVNLTKGGPQAFKTSHHPTFWRDRELAIIDVLMATSAAPTYFPLAEVGSSLYADGGLYANSPDLMALHEAECFLDVPPAEVHILSIGTTTAQFSFSNANGRNFGSVKWMQSQRLIRTILSSQQLSVDNMMKQRLKNRYVRLDHTQSPDQNRDLGLDVATEAAQKTIKGMAEVTIQAQLGSPEIADFLIHEASPPTFFNTTAPGKSPSSFSAG